MRFRKACLTASACDGGRTLGLYLPAPRHLGCVKTRPAERATYGLIYTFRVRRVSALACLLLGLNVVGHAEGADDLAQFCPGAAEWRTEHPEQLAMDLVRRDEGASFTDPALRLEL